jgi:hypothetical protein
MPDSIKTTRIALIVAAGLAFATAALFAFIFVTGAVVVGLGSESAGLLGSALLGATGLFIAAGLTAFGVAELFVASGIAKGRPWARFAGIALAVVSLVAVPVGTVLGSIALLGLLGRDARDWFGGASAARAVPRVPPASV